jgi:hypothetical protein
MSSVISANIQNKDVWIAGNDSTVSYVRKIDDGSFGEVHEVKLHGIVANLVKLLNIQTSKSVCVPFTFRNLLTQLVVCAENNAAVRQIHG